MDPRERTRQIVRRIVRFLILALVFLPVFLLVFGLVVRSLWNWLMPTLFGLPAITFWQAWGLMVLSWILLGGFRGLGGSARHSRHGCRERGERWRQMTPEQRAAVREAVGWRADRAAADPAGGPTADPEP